MKGEGSLCVKREPEFEHERSFAVPNIQGMIGVSPLCGIVSSDFDSSSSVV